MCLNIKFIFISRGNKMHISKFECSLYINLKRAKKQENNFGVGVLQVLQQRQLVNNELK